MADASLTAMIAHAAAGYALRPGEMIVKLVEGETQYGRIVTSYFKAVIVQADTNQRPDPTTRRELIVGVDSNSGAARLCDATEWHPYPAEVYGPD